MSSSIRREEEMKEQYRRRMEQEVIRRAGASFGVMELSQPQPRRREIADVIIVERYRDGETKQQRFDPEMWSRMMNNKDNGRKELEEAMGAIKDMEETLKRISDEPLIMFTIDKVSKDGEWTFVKKGDTELRIKATKDLKQGDEVLLHPKSMQIVESLGRPPLEASRFAPSSPPNVTWDDIGGLEEAKADMIEAIELPNKHKELFKFYKKKPIKGILLSGPPGCGKTMLGKAAAKSLAETYGAESAKTGFLYVKGPEILNMYVGQTEQTIRDMFYDARRHKEEHGYPAIIFLDEADAILAARGSRNIGIGNTIVPMFLTEMDGLEESGAIVIIATNRPDVLDPAIVRDGRIDRKVEVIRPNQANAAAILYMNLARAPIHKDYIPETLAEDIAAVFYGDDRGVGNDKLLKDIVNGAMLANVVDIAISHAIRRDLTTKTQTGVTPEDLTAAIDRIQAQSFGIRHDLQQEGA